MSDFILYNTEDGKAEIKIILDSESQTIWLNQKQMAELFDVKSNTITEHIKNLFEEGELVENSTTRNFRVVQREGSRDIERDVLHFNLKVILAVGYRVRSTRGTQFRKWATDTLNEYLVKGFVMNDERLKDPKGWDYFDELLERVREIRASEKRFYQKIRDLFKITSVDYDKNSDQAKIFYQTVQNKLLFAETGKTAAELIIERADGNLPNMGLTSCKGNVVRKGDITTAKNYLNKDELDNLNRLVTMFLDFAEDRAKRRQQISMNDWIVQSDSFLEFNERNILSGSGKKSHSEMVSHVEKQYEQFEINRKKSEVEKSEVELIDDLDKLVKITKKNGKTK
jgi:hypothetical protein